VLQTLYRLSDEQAEEQLRDRLSFMRFAGLALHDAVPDAKTIWLYREQFTRIGALARLFERFDQLLHERGYLAMGGQIVDATVIEARRPRLTRDEKQGLRDGVTPAGWSKARGRQIDRDGRWTIKRGKMAPPPPRAQRQAAIQILVPAFGDKNHIGIDRAHGFIRRFTVTHAARHDGSQLGGVLDAQNIASEVWATPPIAAVPTWGCCSAAGSSPSSSAPSRVTARCRLTSPVAMPPAHGCAAMSSTSSPRKSAAWDWWCEPSVSHGQRPRSPSQTSLQHAPAGLDKSHPGGGSLTLPLPSRCPSGYERLQRPDQIHVGGAVYGRVK
jgi:IS5 family transposase